MSFLYKQFVQRKGAQRVLPFVKATIARSDTRFANEIECFEGKKVSAEVANFGVFFNVSVLLLLRIT